MACTSAVPSHPVTICPPAPPRHGLAFDEYVHIRRNMPVSRASFDAEGDACSATRISFDDYRCMQTTQRKLASFRESAAPNWSINDKQLRAVLVAYIERRAGLLKAQPGTEFQRLQRAQEVLNRNAKEQQLLLDRMTREYVEFKRHGADARVLRNYETEIKNLDTVLLFNKDIAGKVLHVVHCYYRLGFNSVETEAETGLKPPHVRAMLWRLRKVAASLGFSNPPARRRRHRPRVASPTVVFRYSKSAEKRNAIVSSAEFIALFEKARARMIDPKRKCCKRGHPVCAANAHVGDLRRCGKYACDPCNRAIQRGRGLVTAQGQ
jgi:hypothetical protein